MKLIIPTSTRLTWPNRRITSDISPVLNSDAFDDFDRIVSHFLTPNHFSEVNYQPMYDVNETDNHFMVSLDMPGVKKEDIKIEVRGKNLFISGERRNEIKNRSARSYGKFERAFTLPETVNTDSIEAHYEDGVLNIALPKAEEAKPKSIEIQNGKNNFLSKLLGTNKESSKDLKDVSLS